MDIKQIKDSVSYCGLVCNMCRPDGECSCKTSNHCGKRLSPEGCFQYECCREKGLNGCWECSDSPCDKDMFSKEQIKLRAFITCIKEDSLDKFAEYILKNTENGIVYHRSGIWGDYDLETEEQVLKLLRSSAL